MDDISVEEMSREELIVGIHQLFAKSERLLQFNSEIMEENKRLQDEIWEYQRGMFAKRIPIKDVTLERSTGRKDRNGTPVYENDVIQRYIEPTTGYYYPGNREVVEWKESGTYTGWGMTARTEHRIEVVGTVHEVAA